MLSLLIMKKLYRIGCCIIVLFITVCFLNTTTETTEGLKEDQTEHQYFFIQEGVDWEDIFPCKNATDEHFFPRKTVEAELFFIGISVEDQIFIKEVCEYYEFDEKRMIALGNSTKKMIKLGDAALIKVKAASKKTGTIDFGLVRWSKRA